MKEVVNKLKTYWLILFTFWYDFLARPYNIARVKGLSKHKNLIIYRNWEELRSKNLTVHNIVQEYFWRYVKKKAGL